MTLTAQEVVTEAWRNVLEDINTDIFKYSMVKPMPADWAEQTLILPSNTSKYSGPLSYDLTPYWREPVNHVHESSPVRYVSIMKSVQCGCTACVVIPGLLYIIAVDPENTLFTAGDLLLAKKTIEERLDTILRESGLDHFIRPHAVKKGNQRSGDTAASKEFAGGTLTAGATGSPTFFRYYSAKKGFIDDFDTAKRDVGGEGGIRALVEGRQNSFGNSAQTFFISTPINKATSQIWEQYQLGTQKKWNWPCWNCGAYMMMDWTIKLEDNSYAGMIWRLDGKGRLIKESVCFRCPHCGEVTQEKEKYDLNKNGIWIPTVAEPVEELHESYSMNAIIQPPGFTDWKELVKMWLKANPYGQKANVTLLKSFMMLQLGLPFEEQGHAPKSTALMQNIRDYHHGIIPDKTCDEDGNGKIVLVTISCDLGGVMETDNEDVRMDWEIVAHAQNGVTYSVNQGSIGTFKRNFEKTKLEKQDQGIRKKWTYNHDSFIINEKGEKENNSVWPVFEEIIKTTYPYESGREDGIQIDITVVDTGFFEKSATQFIINMQVQALKVYGIKGRTDLKYRPTQREALPVKRSPEFPKRLYIVDVNQMKDDLADNMALQKGEGASHPSGFMNFPQSNEGKYTYKDYFIHFEGERKKEYRDPKNMEVVLGFVWEKKNSTVLNHFWDVRVYNMAAPLIYLDLIRQSDSKLNKITWEEFVLMVTE